MKKHLLLFFIILLINNLSAQNQIQNIEPPFWFTGMEYQDLQIMLHGTNIANYTPTINYPGVKITGVDTTDNKNYLFVNLKIDKSAKPGLLLFSFSSGKKSFKFSYELREKKKDYKRLPINSKDVIYLITPDRFVNGNTKNDSIKGYFEKADRSDVKFRHGGDIAGIISKLDYIKDMGFTAIWSMPMLQSNMPIYSYHGYSITDFYNIDLRFGTNEDYLNLVNESHKRGIAVIKDMVFNQYGDKHFWNKDKPDKNWVHVWDEFTYSNFNGTVIPDKYASNYDRDRMNKGWFDKWMPDLNQENPLVAKYLIQTTLWWVEYAGIDGIRMDTYQYNYKDFMNDWLKIIKTEYPDLFIVGEVWMNDPEIIAYWKKGNINRDGFASELEFITDFPIQATLNQVFSDYKGIYELYNTVSRDYLYNDPNTNMIFADNHDVTRIFTFCKNDIKKYKQVITFLLTARGIPQIYYGTEILMTGDHHEILRADYPGGWQEDTVNAFTKEGRTDLQNEAFNFLTKLLNWRKNSTVIHNGKTLHFIPYKDTYVYFRYDNNNCVMVAINNGKEDVTLDYNRHYEILKNYISGKEIITDRNISDLKNITVPAQSSIIVELYK
jgi:glycosidase